MSSLKNIKALSEDELLDQFVAFSIDQYEAIRYVQNTRKYNRLFDKLSEIVEELKARGEERFRSIERLLDHSNIQVRLNAARRLMASSPKLARRALEDIEKSGIFPQAGDAGMALSLIDAGIATSR